MTSPAHIRFISAGAGSGKTTALSRILHGELISGRVRPEAVIATTFTIRAATELRERVRAHLIGEGAYPLATVIGAARIGTVNSVCGSLLQRFAFEAKLSTEQRVLDENRSELLLREVMDTVIEGSALSELLQVAGRLSLADAGRASDEIPWRKALKALVDKARANAISASDLRSLGPINASRLLAYFPKKTRRDVSALLRTALDQVLPALHEAAAASGKKNTQSYLELLEGCSKALDQGRLTWADWNKLIGAKPEKGLLALVQPVLDAASLMPEHPHFHADVTRYLELMFDIAAAGLEAYEQAKRQLGAVDFTDQEHLLLKVLDDPGVREILSQELDLLMVDEFQDTSPIQLALFLRMAECAKQVVWVGDIKQAIYGFRGSDTKLMQQVLQALPELGGSKEVLAHSWRSRPSLVYFVNDVFGSAFSGIERADVVLEPERIEFEGTPAIADWLLQGSNQAATQAALTEGIARLIQQKPVVVDAKTGLQRPLRLSDIAILVRMNSRVTEIAQGLRAAGIPSATRQPGLLKQPEAVLAVACLRRLNDERDSLATAEIVSLADCTEPEQWLADRLQWLQQAGLAHTWMLAASDGRPAHPILEALHGLRKQLLVLSPREAVELVIERCGLARRVVQWSPLADVARTRIANLDRLLDLATQYEDEARSSRGIATLSGFLLWLQQLAQSGKDDLAEPAVDAVQVLTHHGAKGLEWNVVVLCDLETGIRDRLWDIEADSMEAFDVGRPLHKRFIRYWPWPFGPQKNVSVAETIAQTAFAQQVHLQAVEESKRLLYVSMTRARDLLVLARRAKADTGEWMETVGLGSRLPKNGVAALTLGDGRQVPFERWDLSGSPSVVEQPPGHNSLAWWDHATEVKERRPLRSSPSAVTGTRASIEEVVRFGSRIETGNADDRSLLGQAIHGCVAARLVSPQTLEVQEVQAILDKMGVGSAVDPIAVHGQVEATAQWIRARWPGAVSWVETPVRRATDDGQLVAGRTDLLIEEKDGWILLDHKSTPAGPGQWEAIADAYAGQLAAYRDVIEAASDEEVQQTWLVLPVVGAALRLAIDRAVPDVGR